MYDLTTLPTLHNSKQVIMSKINNIKSDNNRKETVEKKYQILKAVRPGKNKSDIIYMQIKQISHVIQSSDTRNKQ